jgi:hypothetical protein
MSQSVYNIVYKSISMKKFSLIVQPLNYQNLYTIIYGGDDYDCNFVVLMDVKR